MIQFFKKQLYPNGVKTLNDTFKDYKTFAKVVSVYDGDTITCIFNLRDKSEPIAWKCRFYGIDCPEITSNNKYEKELGLEAKKYVETMLNNKNVYLICKGIDKYGRVLTDVFVENDKGDYTFNLNQDLIDKNYAKKYDGKTKERWAF